MIRKPQFLIGAATSGSGKTTFTMGLLYALKSRGMNVQPFKCGPDYIDTQFHSVASGNISVNLDTWMSSERHVADLYGSYGKDADVCVIEGVMGLFDGYDKMKGSSADISRLLDIPVILVVNAKSVAYSVAPLIHGFSTYHLVSGLQGWCSTRCLLLHIISFLRMPVRILMYHALGICLRMTV